MLAVSTVCCILDIVSFHSSSHPFHSTLHYFRTGFIIENAPLFSLHRNFFFLSFTDFLAVSMSIKTFYSKLTVEVYKRLYVSMWGEYSMVDRWKK